MPRWLFWCACALVLWWGAAGSYFDRSRPSWHCDHVPHHTLRRKAALAPICMYLSLPACASRSPHCHFWDHIQGMYPSCLQARQLFHPHRNTLCGPSHHIAFCFWGKLNLSLMSKYTREDLEYLKEGVFFLPVTQGKRCDQHQVSAALLNTTDFYSHQIATSCTKPPERRGLYLPVKVCAVEIFQLSCVQCCFDTCTVNCPIFFQDIVNL